MPILAGFHPDPSICRVGDDFYLVTSTFEYFPGLPVHHSRDLVNWELIGAALDRPEQLDLDGIESSKGLYAPTIRHHDGVFYLVCTLVGPAEGHPGGNFVVTATDPAGPWSDPVWLGEPESFDPSLFFDGDDVWFVATRLDHDSPVEGRTEVWVQRFDPASLSLTGPATVIWNGALVDARWAEAPHLYRAPDGSVLLMIAEAGTAYHHAVTCAKADQVTGPYRNNPANPVLTHRHLGERYPVMGAGHADLVDAPDGTWWVVLLAMRVQAAEDGAHYPMGRETFLAEVVWEDGWPIVNPGVGALREEQPGLDGATAPMTAAVRDDFEAATLGPHWSYLRTPRTAFVELAERPGRLGLRPQPTGIDDIGCPAFISRPQAAWDFTASGRLDFAPRSSRDAAGIVLRQNENFTLQLLITLDDEGRRVALVVRRFAGVDEVAGRIEVPEGPLELSVHGSGLEYSFAVDGVPVATAVDGRGLSTSLAGGFTGVMLGPYAVAGAGGPAGGGEETDVPVAWWDWFELR
jgi:xylan 1,4-beta-xylosidase